VSRKISIPFCSALGFVVGKLATRGINIPSVAAGFKGLLALISKIAFGVVVPIPTWQKPSCDIRIHNRRGRF